jgi:transposase
MKSTNELLAVDTKGRVRVSLERREMLLREFDGCGLSAAAYAKHVGVKYQTFIYWLKRRREGGTSVDEVSPRVAPAWMEASVEAPRASSGETLRLELPGGAHAVIASAWQVQVAAELLRVLAMGAQRLC